jgi:diacylglycerol O-acyltransferase / wax synthase
LWPIMRSFVGNLRELSRRSEAAEEPRTNPFTANYPRTRFNYALGVKRSFATCQLPLEDLKSLKNSLGITLNDVVLAIMAGALRNYFVYHNELPEQALATSIPVGADGPEVQRQMGNNVTTLFTLLHTEIEDPLERLYAIKKDTEQGKADLEVFGKHQWGDLMQYVPPGLMTWSCRRNFRLKPANKPDFSPNCNIAISNVPGPREKMKRDEGALEAIYSAGVLGEGMGLNITVWSYVDQLNVGALACRKAMPDLHRLTDAIPNALRELQQAATDAA